MHFLLLMGGREVGVGDEDVEEGDEVVNGHTLTWPPWQDHHPVPCHDCQNNILYIAMNAIPPSGTLPWECQTTILYLAMTVRPQSYTFSWLSYHNPVPCHDCKTTILYIAMTVRPPTCTLPWLSEQHPVHCHECHTTIWYLAMRLSDNNPLACHDRETTILYFAMTLRPQSYTLPWLSYHNPVPCDYCKTTIQYIPWDRQTPIMYLSMEMLDHYHLPFNDCQTHHPAPCQETVIIWHSELWPFATSSPSSTSSSLTPTSLPPLTHCPTAVWRYMLEFP